MLAFLVVAAPFANRVLTIRSRLAEELPESALANVHAYQPPLPARGRDAAVIAALTDAVTPRQETRAA